MHYLSSVLILVITKTIRSENCDGNFCPPTPPKPSLLSMGGSNGHRKEFDPATGCFCIERVGTLTICFGRTGCTTMTKNILIRTKYLKLINTHIKVLGQDDFKKLDYLVDLQIEGNFDLERIQNGTFNNLNNLVNLSISYNKKLKVIETIAFQGLFKLKHMFLNTNGFESLHDVTRSLSPIAVPNLITLVMDSNSFPAINQFDFVAMTNSTLEELSLNLCQIEYIHPHAMIPLANLQRLHIGENTINETILTNMLENMLRANIDLQTVCMGNMGFKKAPPRPLMEVIAKFNISQLSLAKNQFEILDNNSFPFLPNLMLLDLRDVVALQITDDAFSNLPNMTTLLLRENKLTEIPRGVLSLKKLMVLDMQDNSPSENYHAYFNIRQVEFSNMTNLLRLNLAFNGLAHLFDTSFKGLPFLQELILNNSSVYHIQLMTFSVLTELRILNLMNNIMTHDDAVPDVFSSLTKLKVLMLSGCRFKYISRQGNPFRNLKSLEYLALDKNLLVTLAPTDFQPLTSLTTIDLSYNLLNSWEKRVFESNTNLRRAILAKNKLTDITLAMYQDMFKIGFIDLDQNAILCTCMVTYQSYRKWYEITYNDDNNNLVINGTISGLQTSCGYPDHLYNVSIIEFLTKKTYGEQICNFRLRTIFFLLPLICTLALFALLGALAFWYRWHIKYWIFLAKLYLSRKGKIKTRQQKKCYTNYEYDAFVSYSTEDRDFVIKLVTMVEKTEPFLKLCVYERDFQIGTIISESVLESVAKSRKTVLVITDSYAKSQWCRWESQICEHHRLFFENEHGEYVDDSLVLIKLSTVSESHLTPTLKYLLKTRIYLEWALDERKQEEFWSRLRSTLGPPTTIVENTTSS